jgi:DNA-binding PadR family transcriptional regulator
MFLALSHTLLGLLSYGPMTGYELKQVFDRSINHFWNAQMSQIYRELNNIEVDGWLTSEIEKQDGKPDKRVYTVTEAGRTAFLKWLEKFPAALHEPIRSDFLVRIFFASELELSDVLHEVKRFLRQQQEALDTLANTHSVIKDYQQMLDEGTDKAFFWQLTLNMGIRHTKTSIEWAEESIKLIEERMKSQNEHNNTGH